MRRLGRLLLTALCSLLLTACGSDPDAASNGAALQLQSPGSLLIDQLPALAELSGLPRQASATELIVREGDEAVLTGAAAGPTDPTALALTPGPDALSYGIYAFSLAEESENIAFVSVELLELSAAGEQFLAISNFVTGRWELLTIPAAVAGAQTLFDATSRSPQDYASPLGTCFVAVLAYDGLALTIDKVTLATGFTLLPPANVATNGIGPQDTSAVQIEINWTPAALADGYDLYARFTELGPEEPFMLIASIPGGDSSSFTHTRENPPEFFPLYNKQIEYKLKSRNGDDESPLFSSSALGVRTARPPVSLSGIDQVHPELIFLEWESVEDAESYFIYQDNGDGDPVAEVSETSVAVAPGDSLPHHYFVATMASDGEGLFKTQTASPVSCIAWQTHSPKVSDSREDRFPHLAIIGGLPAIAFADLAGEILYYMRATVPEPDEGDDWLLMSVDVAEVDFPLGLIEHEGRPWILYHDGGGAEDNEELRVAFAEDSQPQDIVDWTSYAIFETQIASRGIKVAQVGGLLRFIYQDIPSNGGQTLIFYAQTSAPDSADDWTLDVFDPESIEARDYDIAEINGGLAVAYEKDGLIYKWTSELQPDELSDWQTSTPPLPAEFNLLNNIDLVETPDGKPQIMSSLLLLGDTERHYYLHSAGETLPQDADWNTVGTFDTSLGSLGVALCHYVGRPLCGLIGGDNSLQMSVPLALPPQDVETEWCHYMLFEDAPDHDLTRPLSLVLYDGRPLAAYGEDDNGSFKITLARVLAPQ